MARLITSGAEIRDHPTTDVGSPDGWTPGTTATVSETSTYRSGGTSFKCSGTSVNTSYRAFGWTAPASGATLYARAFINVGTLPNATKKVLAFLTSADAALVSVRLTSSGTFQLWNDAGSAQIGSTTALTLATGAWYRVQLRLKIGAGAVDEAELRVKPDSPLEADEAVSGTSLTVSDTHGARLRAGWVDAPGVTADLFVDGVAVNDSTGTTYENSWPGAGMVLLSKPVWTSWTASTSTDCSGTSPTAAPAGGGENMADALNNTPPLGVADHTTAGHAANPDQIRSTSTASVKAWCQTFADIGAPGDLYNAFTLGATSVQVGSGSTSNALYGDSVAQSFLVNGTLEKFRAPITASGAGTGDYSLTVDLVEDNAGQPTGSLIQTWTRPTTGSGTIAPDAWYVLDTPLACYRKLWVTARPTAGNHATNYFMWKAQTTEMIWPGYLAAQKRGSTWTTEYANYMLGLYTSQGYRAPKVITGLMCHGEAIATGTKTFSSYSVTTNNPTPATTSGNVGNDAGAAGTYPGNNWAWSQTAPLYRPPSTNSSAGGTDKIHGGPRMAVTLTSASRFSLLCFMGSYVELDEVYTGDWTRFQKTSDSSIWWGKQATATTTYECGTDGLTIVTVPPGDWAMYPDPQIDAGENYPTTTVAVTDETRQSGYTFA